MALTILIKSSSLQISTVMETEATGRGETGVQGVPQVGITIAVPVEAVAAVVLVMAEHRLPEMPLFGES